VYKNTSGIGIQLSPTILEQEVKPEKVTRPRRKAEKGLIAVPVTRLYDQGIMIRTSEILDPRLEQIQVIIHPTEAEKGGFSDTDRVELRIGKRKYQTALYQDPSVPKGVVLIPRSIGIPLDGQTAVQLKAAK
jgi:hypothetical protein